MTPEKLKLARNYMGYSVNEMADALRLSPANGGTTVRKMEAGKVNITGPIMRCSRCDDERLRSV
jgi:DNA-binding XRE family transcriptional regulator